MKMIAILLHVTSRMQYDVFRTNSVIRMHFITTFDSFYILFIFIYLLRERAQNYLSKPTSTCCEHLSTWLSSVRYLCSHV